MCRCLNSALSASTSSLPSFLLSWNFNSSVNILNILCMNIYNLYNLLCPEHVKIINFLLPARAGSLGLPSSQQKNKKKIHRRSTNAAEFKRRSIVDQLIYITTESARKWKAPNIRQPASTKLCLVLDSSSLYCIVTLKGHLDFTPVQNIRDHD